MTLPFINQGGFSAEDRNLRALTAVLVAILPAKGSQ